ncbi:type I polyketide synthase [Micromonospora sp. NPDC003816]|uniref:type I polyketide synthase n=1 Tax=Micromonospora sp. NPDC003816 TaxID=3364224 RepID=UPI0036CC1CCD
MADGSRPGDPATPGPQATLTAALSAVRQLRQKVDALERSAREPLAIVGIGCRLPGGVTSAETFWQALIDGVDGIVEVPRDRWHTEDAPPGDVFRQGGFIDGVADFDPYFFGISPREAARMDPQQRLFLETSWEALENAGLTRDQLRGSATGVFVGANATDYLQLQLAEPADVDTYTVVGGVGCIIANRLSYLLDLRGPSLTLDTACSSSLVAVHLAGQSLRTRECDTAVVGGMNVILSPTLTEAHARGLPLAPDGRCKTFDARADGYGRGEGVAVVVLKRLSDAVAAGDRIWAVIAGSAVNQDGLTNGLTAPSGHAQRAVITTALRNAQVNAGQVTLLEAHGTGTELGDPIEVEALGEVYGAATDATDRCALGSAKTNLGHLEAGAGIVGMIKVALSIRHRAIPPLLHLERLNPHLDLDDTRLFIPRTAQSWEVPTDRRYGAVSSFGAGGTNAHVVLGPAPEPRTPVVVDESDGEPVVLSLTAAAPEALTAMARAYVTHLRSPEALARPLAEIAYATVVRRTQHDHRLTVVAATHEEAARRLTEWLDTGEASGVSRGRARNRAGRKVVFVVPGQGGQRAGMGAELMRHCPHFRAAVTECDEAFRRVLGRSILDAVHGLPEGTELTGIDVIQPALFAMAVGLAARYRAAGVEPDAVVGHSMGEIAAAYLAGALSLDDAARIVCRRSALLLRIAGQGEMLLAALPTAAAEELVTGHEHLVSVAVCNSPTSTVLSGDPVTLARIADRLRADNVFSRPVRVDVASHSPQVDALTDDLLTELAGIRPRAGTVPVFSTVTRQWCDGSGFDPDYWVRNLRAPVMFWPAVQALVAEDHGVFVELSPHPILTGAVEEGFDRADRDGLALASLRRDEPETYGLATVLGALHANGLSDALRRRAPHPVPMVPLPGYTWQHERLWFDQTDRPRTRPRPTATASEPTTPEPRTPEVTDTSPDPTTGPTARTADDLRRLVLDVVCDILRMDASRIEPHDGFVQLGMDSMLAARIRARLGAALDRRLPATVMFEHPTVAALTAHLTALVAGAGDDAPPDLDVAPPVAPHRVVEHVEELSEEELLDMLAEELNASTGTGEIR